MLNRNWPGAAVTYVDAVYGAGLHPGLRMAAEGSLYAILGYLEASGRARVDPGDTYTLTE